MPTPAQQEWLARLGVDRKSLARASGSTAAATPRGKVEIGEPEFRPPKPAPAAAADLGAMRPDCRIVRGKVPGPKHHVLCATHRHVVDEQARKVIATDLDDYKKRFPAGGRGAAPAPHGNVEIGEPEFRPRGATAATPHGNVEIGEPEFRPRPPKAEAPGARENGEKGTGAEARGEAGERHLPVIQIKREIKLHHYDITPKKWSKVKLKLEVSVAFSCKVVPGPATGESPPADLEMTVGKASLEIAQELWEKEAKTELEGESWFETPKLVAKGDAKEGLEVTIAFPLKTRIGGFEAQFELVHLSRKEKPRVLDAKIKYEAMPVKFAKRPCPGFPAITLDDIEAGFGIECSIEPAYAEIIADALKEKIIAAAESTAEAAASVVEMLGGMGAGMFAGAILAEAAMVAAFAKEIADQAEIDATAQAIQSMRGEIRIAFTSALHGKAVAGEGAAKIASERGTKIYQDVFAEIKKEMPDASDDDIRAGLAQMDFSRGKAPEVMAQFEDELAKPFRQAAWRKWAEKNHGLLTTPSLAREAYAACFNKAPADDDPEWQLWAKG